MPYRFDDPSALARSLEVESASLSGIAASGASARRE